MNLQSPTAERKHDDSRHTFPVDNKVWSVYILSPLAVEEAEEGQTKGDQDFASTISVRIIPLNGRGEDLVQALNGARATAQ